MKQEVTTKKVFIRTLGWPLVTVARDGAGSVKEGKWFGLNGLWHNGLKAKNLFNVA